MFGDYPSLKELLEAVSAENARAVQSLYEKYNPVFSVYALRYLRRKHCRNYAEHCPGVMHLAWGKIFKGIEGLRDCRSFVPWGYRITRNEAATHLRRCIREQQREVSFEAAFGEREPAALIDSADDDARSAEHSNEVLAYAEEINLKLPEILILHLHQGLDFNEIALRIGESYHNTRNIYYRGLEKIKRKFKNEGF